MDQITAAQPITPDTLVLQVVESYPQTTAVFNDLNMACPGCHVSPFHTIADSAREYGFHPDELLRALNDALASNATGA
jgi:hybrid cluster-associated redox disulfide protein